MIKITFLGDLMCDSIILEMYKNHQEELYDFSGMFSEIKTFLSQSDFVIANLETPIAGEYLDYTHSEFSFNTPASFLDSVKDAGIHLVTTANNHCLDRGIEGLKNTIRKLDEKKLLHIGSHLLENEDSFIPAQIHTTDVGICAFTYDTNAFANKFYLKKKEQFYVDLLQKQILSNYFLRLCYFSKLFIFRCIRKISKIFKLFQFEKPVYERQENNKHELKRVKEIIESCKHKGNVCITCLHVGGQYNPYPTAYTKEMCSYCVDCGADIVIANHEHVIHPVHITKERKLIVYSLGNFVSSSGILRPPFDCDCDYSLGVHIYFEKEKIKKQSISLFKNYIDDKGKIKVILVSELMKNTEISVNDYKVIQIKYQEILNKTLGTKGVIYPITNEVFF